MIVPGLDFCNHALRPNARWEAVAGGKALVLNAADTDTGVGPPQAQTWWAWLTGAGAGAGGGVLAVPASGEITLSYGHLGNEETLFSYGFVLPSNPHERTVLPALLVSRRRLRTHTLARAAPTHLAHSALSPRARGDSALAAGAAG